MEVPSLSKLDTYDFVAMDITSNCNLRCPFCFNDFSTVKNNVLMTESILDKVLTLLPLVEDGKFLFSCLYEPSLNPDFIKLLNKVPLAYRKKVYFTLNLAKTLPDEMFEAFSHTGIHHINVSFDSLTPHVFEKLRKGAKFETFIDNLQRMVTIFSRVPDAPPLQYITIALKSNLAEIPELVKMCHTRYLAADSEIRPPWTAPSNAEFLKKEMLDMEEWNGLEKELAKLPYRYQTYSLSHSLTKASNNAFFEGIKDEERKKLYSAPDLTGIRISSEGLVEFVDRDIFTRLEYIADPYHLFKDLLPILRTDVARAEELQRITNTGQLPSIPTEMDIFIRFLRKLSNNSAAKSFYRKLIRPIFRFFLRFL